MRIAIVLVNWNGWRDTVECLSSVLASDAADRADIYVVDNDSSDASVERILHWCERPVLATACSALEGVRHAAAVAIPCRVWRSCASTRACFLL